MRRDLDVAALLEPRVPADPDAGELCDLLAPQPRRAAARAGDEADVRRRQPRSAAYQKVGEVAAVGIAFEVWHGQLLSRILGLVKDARNRALASSKTRVAALLPQTRA